MKHRVEIFGHGQATRIVATDKSIRRPRTVATNAPAFSTPALPQSGTNQNKPMRMGVRDLFIRTNKYNLPLDSKSNQIFWRSTPSPSTTLQALSPHPHCGR